MRAARTPARVSWAGSLDNDRVGPKKSRRYDVKITRSPGVRAPASTRWAPSQTRPAMATATTESTAALKATLVRAERSTAATEASERSRKRWDSRGPRCGQLNRICSGRFSTTP